MPSGAKWATCNVGASSPEEYGAYFAWGETSPRNNYDDNNSLTLGKSISDLNLQGITDSCGNLTMSHDVAHSKWGGVWRMPTKAECQELVDKCKWSWVMLGGHKGYKVTGPNGRSIFLPSAGRYWGTSVREDGEYASYWSCSSYPDDTNLALFIAFQSDYYRVDWNVRSYGRTIRAVCR